MYDDWRGPIYPTDAPKSQWFELYTERFDTVELNSTFYRLPEEETVDRWRRQAPAGFIYAVKLSRYGTHQKKLRDPSDWVAKFEARAERLGESLGPILVQLPPRWRVNVERLDAFLGNLGRGKWAIEVRDPSWLSEEVFKTLRDHSAALCLHDLIPEHPDVATTSWVYERFHGPDPENPLGGSYSRHVLEAAARRLGSHLDAGRDVYAYFNNDVGGSAVDDAAALLALLQP